MTNAERSEASAKAKRLLEQVREILFQEWDPIGVGDKRELRDEYDHYAFTICRYLMERADENRLAVYLGEVRTESMELNADPESDRVIARTLLTLEV